MALPKLCLLSLAFITYWRVVFIWTKIWDCVLLRVHLSGCYISKMTYMREGERSFTDHEFCRAWHVVTYYRLIRFLPGQF